MAQKSLTALLLLITAMALQGCASLVHGTDQQVLIHSVPSGADIHLNGNYRGTTPQTLTLQRGAEYTLLLEHPGYQPWDLDLERRLSGWTFGNLVTGMLGAGVDAVDGAAFRVYPPGVTATLIPVRERQACAVTDSKPSTTRKKVAVPAAPTCAAE